MQNELIQLNDREIDAVSGGVAVFGGTIINLSGASGTGSKSVAILGQTAAFGGNSAASAGAVLGPTAIFF